MSSRARLNQGPLLHVFGMLFCVIAVLTLVSFLVAAPAPPMLVTVDAIATNDDVEAELPATEESLPLEFGETIPVETSVEPDVPMFNGRPLRAVGTITMRVTAYSPDERSCGLDADGITASGYSVWTNGMRLVAADTKVLPFGTLLSVPGYHDGAIAPVLDRGGRIKGNRLDVLYATHERAREWGVQTLDVTVWEYADGKPNGFRQQH
ncbi:MAG: 3D domain-containing protein [Planctomycetota bacterium]